MHKHDSHTYTKLSLSPLPTRLTAALLDIPSLCGEMYRRGAPKISKANKFPFTRIASVEGLSVNICFYTHSEGDADGPQPPRALHSLKTDEILHLTALYRPPQSRTWANCAEPRDHHGYHAHRGQSPGWYDADNHWSWFFPWRRLGETPLPGNVCSSFSLARTCVNLVPFQGSTTVYIGTNVCEQIEYYTTDQQIVCVTGAYPVSSSQLISYVGLPLLILLLPHACKSPDLKPLHL